MLRISNAPVGSISALGPGRATPTAAPMGEPRRLRAALAMAAACVVLIASAVAYLRPLPSLGHSTPPTAPTSLPASGRLQDLEPVSGTVAWAWLVTAPLGAPLVYRTTDAGRSWHELKVPTAVDQKFGIQVLDRNHGTLQMGHGLYATADGGRTWRRVPLPPGESFGLGARFLSPSVG